ncbi:hypothetical protein IEQ34_026870 [Dendrobium chrysotoxum]|uniref:Aldehyde dehydrogenase domain-containing protein n=1 Tax=Dendrobium chrysotoxum TaxID=161865 RepID=A0AAV7FIF5_DENCH|nr:hypothetical protein IEQ34_026870 [Dendrobium chrysotoxum]
MKISILIYVKELPLRLVDFGAIHRNELSGALIGFTCFRRFQQAGIPDGVINVITGYRPSTGAAISSHMDVDAVSSTGSTEVGKLVMGAAASSNLKTVSLELGGKSPLVIFNDVDINMAVQTAWQAVFFNKAINYPFI